MDGRCEICGGATTCPADTTYAARPEDAGLPAGWTPPQQTSLPGGRGHRYLDREAMDALGVAYEVVGTAQAARIRAHGGTTWWVAQCTYLALPVAG